MNAMTRATACGLFILTTGCVSNPPQDLTNGQLPVVRFGEPTPADTSRR